MADHQQAHASLTRRSLLGLIGAGAVTVAGAGAASALEPPPAPPPPRRPPDYHGQHQQGITSPAQERLAFTAVDVTGSTRADVVRVLRSWTSLAAAMATGQLTGAMSAADSIDPEDLAASRLTVTIGLGPSLFRDAAGRDRFGLAGAQPPSFGPLPAFAGDRLVPGISGGDLCVQACADSEQVAQHAIRTLLRSTKDSTRARWSQSGFGRVGPATGGTPRNLFGFKDGTANIAPDDYAAQHRFVWVQAGDGPAWMEGGTYVATRKIRMNLETWDAENVAEQELTIGRAKGSGAPLSGGSEFANPNLEARLPTGHPAIDPQSHVAVTHPATNNGQRMLRRGYNYIDGTDAHGRIDGGLFFIGFNRDLQAQFIPMMHHLAASDRMNEYVTYLSSACFAIPPGTRAGGYVGETLFEG